MASFDPISALIGGALIGFASVLLMMLTGRIAGISGILTGCFALVGGDKVWRVAFIAGLISAPIAGSLVGHPLPTPLMPMSWAAIVIAGFLVGFGARCDHASRFRRLTDQHASIGTAGSEAEEF